jgi:hypothetical protein
MGRIADTLTSRPRFRPEDGITEGATGTVAGKSQTRKESCQGSTSKDTSDALQGLAP